MKILLSILFWGSVFALFHTYVFFPVALWILSTGKKKLPSPPGPEEPLPEVSILIPAYNEESVIGKKLESILQSDYPAEKIEILVMSDASTDRTDKIIRGFASRHSHLHYFRSPRRTGKPGILNQLVKKARHPVLVMTDANVLFFPETLKNIVKHFRSPKTGLVDTRLVPLTPEKGGITLEETKYNSSEFRIKYREGLLSGIIMGPSGACYAIRKALYHPVPDNFLVDDFFICMNVIRRGYNAYADPDAVVAEDTIQKLSEAFRRKVRIAAGNFQNLSYYRKMLCNIFKPAGILFWSHKGLRWLGPLFLITALITNIFLFQPGTIYLLSLWIQIFLLILIIPDLFLVKINKHIVILRFVTHFYLMNLALLNGLIIYLKGIKTNVWEPTKRNVRARP